MRTFLLRKPMRGKDDRSEILFSYIRLDERIPADHPLRVIRQLVDAALAELSPAFAKLYARDGRPSIPPERLLRALLLQAFYTVRSELQLMEQLNYNLLFRWFVGLSADDPVWDATVFCKNRDRLLNGDIARKFMISVLNLPEVRLLLSSEHFSVDGTLIEAWASMKSFVPKDGSKPPPGKGHHVLCCSARLRLLRYCGSVCAWARTGLSPHLGHKWSGCKSLSYPCRFHTR